MSRDKFERFRRVKDIRVLWSGREEVPWVVFKSDDGTVRWYGSGRVVFDTSDGKITCTVGWHRVSGVVRWVPSPHTRQEGVMALRKIQQAIDQTSARGVGVTEKMDYPLMLEYLTHAVYDDGSKRETSVLVVACDGPNWRVCLTDKDNQRVMWKTGTSLLDCLQCIELSLMADDPNDWRRTADASGKRRK